MDYLSRIQMNDFTNLRGRILSRINKPRIFTGDSTVNVSAGDYVVVVNKASGSATPAVLPQAISGDTYIVKDGKGDANSNNITVTATSAKNIDGSASYVMSVNYQSATFIYNGTQWNII